MSQPEELGAQAFWRADFANAALSVHTSASRDLRVRLSGAATLWRWIVIVVMSVQAVVVLSAAGVAGLEGSFSDISALGVRVSLGAFPQTLVIVASFVAMGFYLVRAYDDEASHSAQTQTLEFVGKNLMARMRFEEWSDQIVSSAANDRAIFIARCAGVVREFCRNPGVSSEDFEAVRAALRAEAPEPHPTLDIMNTLDFSDHAQLKTLINGKKREFKDFVLAVKRRMSESFVDLEADKHFARLAAELVVDGDTARENDARRRRFSRAMRHFGWLDVARDQIETGAPAYQLDGVKALLIHDQFLENLSTHFAKARRLFLYTNAAFVALWLALNWAHVSALLERQPRW